MANATVNSTVNATIEELVTQITDLNKRVEELEAAKTVAKKDQREMTDADALAILKGEQSSLTHNKAAEALKLSYGQVYSCRLGYTFRHIWKQIHTSDPKFGNPWKKA